ncbi:MULTISPECIES: 50S ribosomal protein L44e [Acidianus]|uniref:Large ribosomal subunit protein eL42 n=1 Tax=Candidatus Acidianus copahuensis TaxID=1160895 RepID=A0A031LQC8_9CREN|nr:MULTISPECIES: 50S ribosomal protein L44e [Acidianus]EZQ06940.1 50S ribosomal protein L44 [Candidatus Acidianus copahuensis]NON61737.1 50S ribosomal protein L44e [Acidianus sp. RZ1]
MKVPKTMRVYCPKCKTYTDHSVSQYKSGKRRTIAEGQRRYDRKNIGYGGKRKPEQHKFAKVTKKVVLDLKCTKCGYVIMKPGIRLKKVEITEVIK